MMKIFSIFVLIHSVCGQGGMNSGSPFETDSPTSSPSVGEFSTFAPTSYEDDYVGEFSTFAPTSYEDDYVGEFSTFAPTSSTFSPLETDSPTSSPNIRGGTTLGETLAPIPVFDGSIDVSAGYCNNRAIFGAFVGTVLAMALV